MTPKQPNRGKKTNVTIKGDVSESTVITGDNNKVEIHTVNKQERKIASDLSKVNELLDAGQLKAAEEIISQVETLSTDFPGLEAAQKKRAAVRKKQRRQRYMYASVLAVAILILGGNLINREKERECDTGEKYFKTGVLAIAPQQSEDGLYLWVGYANNGLTIRDRDGASIKSFGQDELQISSITSLVYDEQRKGMWMGSGGGGLVFMDLTQNVKKRFTLKDKIPGCKITDVIVTQKGIYVTAIAGKGLGFSRDGNTWVTYEIPKTYKEKDQFDIYSAAADPDGTIWVGTYQDVYQWDGANWKHYPVKENSPVTVQAIAVGRNSVKWVGTIEGLFLLDTRTGTQWSRQFTVQDGLASNDITSIEMIDDNNAWIGTNSGISRCERKGGELELICETKSENTKLGMINTITFSTELDTAYVGNTTNDPIIIKTK